MEEVFSRLLDNAQTVADVAPMVPLGPYDIEQFVETIQTYDRAHNARLDSELYGQRWMAETAFSAIGCRYGAVVGPRTWCREFREFGLTAAVCNLERSLVQ